MTPPPAASAPMAGSLMQHLPQAPLVESLTQSKDRAAPGILRQYFQLTKPTVTLLVVVTVVPALLLAAPGLPSPLVVWAALFGTFLASASAGTFNQIVEMGRDRAMDRTRRRPLPTGVIRPRHAMAMAVVLGILSVAVLYHWATPLAAVIGVAANVGYVVVYTLWLKPRTVQNIVIGGAAGCVGPLIGWAAVTGSVGWPAWALFMIIFLWTPPHFWALALKYKDDYARAGFPMMPVVRGDAATKRQILWYCTSLLVPVTALWWFGAAGLTYFIPSLLATLWFVQRAIRLLKDESNRSAMPLFLFSCGYLFLVFGALTADCLLAELLG